MCLWWPLQNWARLKLWIHLTVWFASDWERPKFDFASKISIPQIRLIWVGQFSFSHTKHTLIQRPPTVQTQPKTCRINFRLTILLLSFFSPSTALEGRDVLIGKMCRDRAVKLHNTCTVIWSPERTTIPCVQISHNTPRRCSKTATIPCVQMSHNTSQKQPQYHVELNSPMVEKGINPTILPQIPTPTSSPPPLTTPQHHHCRPHHHDNRNNHQH